MCSSAAGQQFRYRGFDASWELDLFGSNRHNVRAAAADMVGAEDARRGAQVSLLAELAKLAKNYVEVCCARQQMAVTQARISGPAGNTGAYSLKCCSTTRFSLWRHLF